MGLVRRVWCAIVGHVVEHFTGFDECYRCGKTWIV